MDAAAAVASNPQIEQWVEQFHRDGFLFVHDVLSAAQCAQLRADLDIELASTRNAMGDQQDYDATLRLRVRLFEHSNANLRLNRFRRPCGFGRRFVRVLCGNNVG